MIPSSRLGCHTLELTHCKRPVPLHMLATWHRADQIGWLQRVDTASLGHEKAVGGMKPAK